MRMLSKMGRVVEFIDGKTKPSRCRRLLGVGSNMTRGCVRPGMNSMRVGVQGLFCAAPPGNEGGVRRQGWFLCIWCWAERRPMGRSLVSGLLLFGGFLLFWW